MAFALLVAVPALMPGVAGATSTPPSTGVQEWAYGVVRTFNATEVNATGTYTVHARFGYHVVLSQTNLTPNTTLVEIQRTMGASVSVNFCQPDCAHPVASANLNLSSWETLTGFSNLTMNGSVEANGSAVRALGIVDSSATATANISDSYRVSAPGLFSARNTSGALSVRLEAALQVRFTPALGIEPVQSHPGQTWTSTANYTSQGSWSALYSVLHRWTNGTHRGGSATVSGGANGSGRVGLAGSAGGPITLRDGSLADAISLSLDGPFSLREGLVLLPLDADLFGINPHPWSAEASGRQNIATSQIDLATTGTTHLGLLATATTYASTSNPPTNSGTSPMSSPAQGTPSSLVQAQPETVSQANAGSRCLLGACPAANGPSGASGLNLRGPGTILLALLVITIVSATAVVVDRRRPVVPPPSPTASLYPPGAALAPSPRTPSGAPGKSPAPPPAEDPPDPLDHLW